MRDMTVLCDDGYINIRAGAIISDGEKWLMMGNPNVDYLYSIGGRLKFGESAIDAVRREVLEELGLELEVDRLGIIHENYYYKNFEKKRELVYEISFYYYMKKAPLDIVLKNSCENEKEEFLIWVDCDDQRTMYPNFIKECILNKNDNIVHICTDERKM